MSKAHLLKRPTAALDCSKMYYCIRTNSPPDKISFAKIAWLGRIPPIFCKRRQAFYIFAGLVEKPSLLCKCAWEKFIKFNFFCVLYLYCTKCLPLYMIAKATIWYSHECSSIWKFKQSASVSLKFQHRDVGQLSPRHTKRRCQSVCTAFRKSVSALLGRRVLCLFLSRNLELHTYTCTQTLCMWGFHTIIICGYVFFPTIYKCSNNIQSYIKMFLLFYFF